MVILILYQGNLAKPPRQFFQTVINIYTLIHYNNSKHILTSILSKQMYTKTRPIILWNSRLSQFSASENSIFDSRLHQGRIFINLNLQNYTKCKHDILTKTKRHCLAMPLRVIDCNRNNLRNRRWINTTPGWSCSYSVSSISTHQPTHRHWPRRWSCMSGMDLTPHWPT